MRRLLAVILVCGCGSVNESKPDAAAGSGFDAMPDVPVVSNCNLTAPFGTPTPVAGINSNSTDEWGWMSPDGKTFYFDSVASGGGDYNIYAASRSSPTGPFTGVAPIATIGNSTDSENRPALTGNELELFYERHVPNGGTHIYSVRRLALGGDFGTPKAAAINSNGIDANPWISADGRTLYWATTNGGSDAGDYNIWRATRANDTDDFTGAQAVAELNMAATVDDAPVLSADGLEIFFASTRGITGVGARNEIWHATRSTTSDGFGTPQKVSELSIVANEDYPNWLSADRCTLIFTSDRPGGNGGYDIWMASRPQ